MSNELVVAFETDDFEAIAAATGASVRDNNILPMLKINRESEDDKGNSVPVGNYVITQNDMSVYGKPIVFRPFLCGYQYMTYSAVEEKYTNKSIIIKSFNEEAHDELGGLRCGKVNRETFEKMSKDQQADQRQTKCYRLIYGTVSFTGVSPLSAEPVEVEDLPVLWRTAGVNFNAATVALNGITKMRHHCFQHNLILDTKRDKKGSNVFYHSLVEADLEDVVAFGGDDIGVFKSFQETVDRENRFVLAKWKDAKKQGDTFDLAGALALDDEIPF